MPKLGIGPLSTETVRAIFQLSSQHNIPLMLIASRNQIDYNHGYVCKTKEFSQILRDLKTTFPKAQVLICRDHCGPGFGSLSNSLNSVYKTIESDIKHDFDLLHIDLCHLSASHKHELLQTANMIRFAQSLSPTILFEIGTNENKGKLSLDQLQNDLDFFTEICQPSFYVIQTGSLVKEEKNVGTFHRSNIKPLADIIHKKGILLKEHNADYLNREMIIARTGIVDAMNIAPQLGVIQTTTILSCAYQYGIDVNSFLELSYKSKKWQKWILPENKLNKYLCAIVAGHYHYQSSEYKAMYEQISANVDLSVIIENKITDTILHYVNSFQY